MKKSTYIASVVIVVTLLWGGAWAFSQRTFCVQNNAAFQFIKLMNISTLDQQTAKPYEIACTNVNANNIVVMIDTPSIFVADGPPYYFIVSPTDVKRCPEGEIIMTNTQTNPYYIGYGGFITVSGHAVWHLRYKITDCGSSDVLIYQHSLGSQIYFF